jgi:TonB family protein
MVFSFRQILIIKQKGGNVRIIKAICFVGVIFLLSACSSEERALNKAEKENTIKAYEDYLQKYPEGKYRVVADTSISHLKTKKFTDDIFANLKETYDRLGLPYQVSRENSPAINVFPLAPPPPPPPPPSPRPGPKKTSQGPVIVKFPLYPILTLTEGYLEYNDPTNPENHYEYGVGNMRGDFLEFEKVLTSSGGKPIYLETETTLLKYDSLVKIMELLLKAGAKEIIPILTVEMEPAIRDQMGDSVPLPIVSENIYALLMASEVRGVEEGGVEGGVVGGVEGGVLGGVVGGVLGGVVGEVEAPVRAIGDIKAPRLIKEVKPIYPEIARQARVEGVVILEATTDIYGRVQHVKVLKSIPLLDQSAIDAVRQWVYEPMIINDRPRGVIFTVIVPFKLK